MTTRFSVSDASPVSAHAAIKLRIPAMPARHVVRHRLVDQLDATGTDGVVVVHGPAGSGKSSLVANWASTLSRPVSWYTLDVGDSVAAEFWTNLVTAIERVRPGSLDTLTALVCNGAPTEFVAAELVVALDAAPAVPATLVVDDLHTIVDQPELTSVFRALVRNPPPGLQLVVLSRSIPPLSLSRAQLDGRVTTISFDELRFTPSESIELLGRLSPGSDQAWVRDAVARGGGWAAGLQMFALAARSAAPISDSNEPALVDGSPVPALQITADYLLAEAFSGEDDELVELLRAIAVVGRVNVPLARALSGREDADVLLQRAFERDLFVTRCGRGWYELHSLVREVLLEQLDQDPERLRVLHARAARHLELDREYTAALAHWMKAHRFRDALRLLSEVHLALYDAGRHDVVRETIETIPVDAYATDFAASTEFAWCQVLVNRNRFLEGVTRLSWWALRAPVSGVLASRLVLLESVAATIRGDWVEGGRLARQAMAELGPEWILDPYGRFGLNMVGRDAALSERWHDGDDDVRRARVELVEDPIRGISFEGIRALGEALGGQPLAAIQTVGGIRDIADVANMAILREELGLAELIARRELGDDDGVVVALEALANTDVAPTTYIRARASAELVAAHLECGAIDSAQNSLTALHEMVDHTIAGVGARTWAARCAAELALVSGDDGAAEQWTTKIDDAFWQPVVRARSLLARLDHESALVALGEAVPRCSRHDVVLALQMAMATREHEEALKHAIAAVETAVAFGMVRTVVAQGPAAVELVERCAWRAPVGWLDRVRRAAVAASPVEVESRAAQAERRVPLEPLTERERDVLRFLPSRLTLPEIANELYISMNTLKFHLKVIYRKLGVASRADAAEAARQMTTIRS